MVNEELAKYDYVILIDKSGSMSTEDCPGGKSRWQYVQEQALNVARRCAQFDNDGIDIIVFASSPKFYGGVTPEKVEQVFRENSPGGSTDTAAAIQLAFDGHFAKNGSKPSILLCFTDGEPNDKKAVERAIITAANKLTVDEDLAITFLQVGKDEGARRFLKHLDDELQNAGAKFDIVDTKDDSEMENLSVEDILIQAVTD